MLSVEVQCTNSCRHVTAVFFINRTYVEYVKERKHDAKIEYNTHTSHNAFCPLKKKVPPPFILDVRLVDVPAGGHIGFLIHLPSAVLALIFFARRIQPFLPLVDRDVEFRV